MDQVLQKGLRENIINCLIKDSISTPFHKQKHLPLSALVEFNFKVDISNKRNCFDEPTKLVFKDSSAL